MKQRITITTKPGVLKVGETVTLIKERANQFDNEAIAVMAHDPAGGLRPEGYVSAFYKTRKPDTISAGRIYDRFKDAADAVVVAEGIVEVELP
jgi:hypothetical protein